jgi:hypothetical protein
MKLMTVSRGEARMFEVVCPCCGAILKVDAELGKVLHHEVPVKPAKGPDLDQATRVLRKEAERREAMFRQSAEDEKHKTELLDRKFAEALKRTKDEPAEPPLKDIDLD